VPGRNGPCYNQRTMPIPKTIIIDGSEFAVFTEAVPGSVFEATVGTNCPQGGDARGGGRTVLILEDMSADIWCRIDNRKLIDRVGRVEIVFGGDDEAERLAKGLRFAADTLEVLLRANRARDQQNQSKQGPRAVSPPTD